MLKVEKRLCNFVTHPPIETSAGTSNELPLTLHKTDMFNAQELTGHIIKDVAKILDFIQSLTIEYCRNDTVLWQYCTAVQYTA